MSSEMKRLLAMFFGIVLLSAVLGALGMFVYSGLLTGTGTFLAAPLAFLTATQLAATITFSFSIVKPLPITNAIHCIKMSEENIHSPIETENVMVAASCVAVKNARGAARKVPVPVRRPE